MKILKFQLRVLRKVIHSRMLNKYLFKITKHEKYKKLFKIF